MASAKHDVLRLDVAMDHIVLMREVQGVRHPHSGDRVVARAVVSLAKPHCPPAAPTSFAMAELRV
jgi:hypothetical protein